MRSDDAGRMSGSIDLLLILPTVPPSLLCLTTLSLLSFCLSLGHLFTRLSMQPESALFAQWGISCVWAVGYRRSTELPPSPSAGDGGAAAALLGYTDRNAEQGNSILRVHLGRQR